MFYSFKSAYIFRLIDDVSTEELLIQTTPAISIIRSGPPGLCSKRIYACLEGLLLAIWYGGPAGFMLKAIFSILSGYACNGSRLYSPNTIYDAAYLERNRKYLLI